MTVQVAGTIVYGFLDSTAGVLNIVGEAVTSIPIIGPPIGNAFIVVGDATQRAAYAVAQATRVGPYRTVG
ncbi:hypothetical protein [Mycolicibacterium sarraceniae]|uniref:Uncharacterized protein n=1 Tax=Mycolicibacterium sarraceniae TaxID=1534348 RepID=A0A7I7SQU7_9MYCO|nr:hypothetical protein [Mycolicibacterium sarraceniae]BBY59374.1 hypothetical protein MSAR_25100 [Mycolicibacterium sarraceniae]